MGGWMKSSARCQREILVSAFIPIVLSSREDG
jgi:hypothetical protein